MAESEGRLQPSPVVKRSVVISGHKTSVSLEADFWVELKREAAEKRTTLGALIDKIDQARTHGNLSSALRRHVLAQALRPKG